MYCCKGEHLFKRQTQATLRTPQELTTWSWRDALAGKWIAIHAIRGPGPMLKSWVWWCASKISVLLFRRGKVGFLKFFGQVTWPNVCTPASKRDLISKHSSQGLERWLIFQKTWVYFLTPTWWPTTVWISNLTPSSGLQGMHVIYKHICRRNTHMHNK